jgi:Questin oxidase-like
MLNTDSTNALSTLLDRTQNFAPEYRGSLSTHLPMALVALRELGADAARMDAFFTTSSAKLSLAPVAAAPVADWLAARGDRSAFPAMRAHFVQAIAERGRDAVLRETLPPLIDGVAAVAFHGLLRTASATVANHDAELASGLAVWACGHLPIASFVAVPAPVANAISVEEWLNHMTDSAGDWQLDTGMITPQIRAFVRTKAFREGADRLPVHEGTLAGLEAAALSAYLRSADFTALHLITSSHAMRLLLPWFDERIVALRHYARAFSAGFAASGAKLDMPLIAVDVLSWSEALAAGIASDDEHVIKLAYACHEQWKVTGDDAYLRAASLGIHG